MWKKQHQNFLGIIKNKKSKEWKRFKATGYRNPFETVFEKFDSLVSRNTYSYVDKMKSNKTGQM